MSGNSSGATAVFSRTILLAIVFAASVPAEAQHHRDYRGIDARSFNPGGFNPSYGSGSIGNGSFGQPGFYPRFGVSPHFGSSATYNSSRLSSRSTVVLPNYIGTSAVGMYGFPLFPGWYGGRSIGVLPPLTTDPCTGQLVPFYGWYGLPGYGSSLCGNSYYASSLYVSGLPYFGGINSSYTSAVLAPAVLNVNLSMQPAAPMGVAYNLTDPRLIDLIAPAPDAQIPVQNAAANNLQPGDFDAPPSEIPLLNEFQAFPLVDSVSTLADKINSLRFQSTGDGAFRNENYEAAEAAYRAGIESAPDRRSLWFRMAFLMIAREDFPGAVQFLKTGLMMREDPTRSWVSAEELYGRRAADRTQKHAGKLWNWLAAQPLSSDRLLLAGTFQKFRGFGADAGELLDMASFDGPEAEYVAAVTAIADNDPGPQAIARQLDQMLPHSSEQSASESADEIADLLSAPGSAQQTDGISLHRNQTDNSSEDAPPPPQPEFTIPKP